MTTNPHLPKTAVQMDHLMVMGSLMALYAEQEQSGLSEPQYRAMQALQETLPRVLPRLEESG